ncbi:MAG: CopG family transcriptional regulator [Anaerolineae bacterium]|nr:CopG family transcriptional regulator [Anaerolineae bacterium]
MANVKTAISIDKSLFEQVNKLADKLEVSRSHLFVLAVEEFIQRYENEQLLRQLNQAYDDLPLADEEQLFAGRRSSHRNLVEGEW